MVELLPLDEKEDGALVRSLLEEFHSKTSSEIAHQVLNNWPDPRFIKVFPLDYQKALRELKIQSESAVNGTNGHHSNGDDHKAAVKDIEDVVSAKVNGDVQLDKLRGFMKYQRETQVYRPADKRQKDWDEIYNFEHVRKGLRTQASRCMVIN